MGYFSGTSLKICTPARGSYPNMYVYVYIYICMCIYIYIYIYIYTLSIRTFYDLLNAPNTEGIVEFRYLVGCTVAGELEL